MSLGGMLTFTVRDPSNVCMRVVPQSETCQSGDFVAEKVFGFQGGALF
jgi:hypothetical protein